MREVRWSGSYAKSISPPTAHNFDLQGCVMPRDMCRKAMFSQMGKVGP